MIRREAVGELAGEPFTFVEIAEGVHAAEITGDNSFDCRLVEAILRRMGGKRVQTDGTAIRSGDAKPRHLPNPRRERVFS